MVMIAGKLQQKNCSLHTAWTIALTTAALLTLIISVYHTFFIPAAAKKIEKKVFSGKRFVESFKTFFSRPGIWKVIFFLFFYRFAESQLGKMAVTFMITPVSDGGLGLTIEQQGEISGIVGTAAFWIGGLLAGWAVARFGFGKCIIPMVLALNVPDVLYLLMTWYIPNIYVISG